jgi:hypothetical protein
MAFEVEVKKHAFSKTIFYIDEKYIRFDHKEYLIKDIIGFGYLSTQNKVNGINASKLFQIHLWQKDQPKPVDIRFMGTFGGGNVNDKFNQIVENLWVYFGNDLLDKLHKHLMAGQVYELTPKVKLISTGMVVRRKPWFRQPYEVLGNWNDLSMNAGNGYMWVKSTKNKKASISANFAWKNIWLYYHYISWLFKNPGVIAQLMAVPNNYRLMEKR